MDEEPDNASDRFSRQVLYGRDLRETLRTEARRMPPVLFPTLAWRLTRASTVRDDAFLR